MPAPRADAWRRRRYRAPPLLHRARCARQSQARALAGPARALRTAAAAPPVTFDGDWPALVARLKVAGHGQGTGPAQRTRVERRRPLPAAGAAQTLIERRNVDKLRRRSRRTRRAVRVRAEVGSTRAGDAAGLAEKAKRERQRQAEEAIYGDPFVRELIDNFGASVDPASIQPRDANDTGTKR